ncbi:hypothetical protein LCGC14_2261390, partial [marine sediment metagenome]
NFNLDYFLITSELPALEETLNAEYSSSNNPFSVSYFYGDSHRLELYKAFRTHTIGYIEQKIKLESNGEFDTIRPLVINGASQYMFVDSQDDSIRKTQPLSSLYSPIYVSQWRYDELVRQGKYKDAVMKIFTDCAYGSINDGFNAYQLHPSEAELYQAKIPLSPTEFNYPIISVSIDLLGVSGELIKTVEVDVSDYTVIDGNLYFTRTLEEIVFSSKAEWEGLAIKTITRINHFGRRYYVIIKSDFDYSINVVFATVVPYSESYSSLDPYTSLDPLAGITITPFAGISNYAGWDQGYNPIPTFGVGTIPYPSMSYGITGQYLQYQDIIDTNSNDQARMILAQATSYALAEYFNIVQMGWTDATNKAERDYTAIVTLWSTLISSLVLLPITVARLKMKPKIDTYKRAVVRAVSRIPIAMALEVFEEIYIDPYIEAYIYRKVLDMGGSEETAQMLSLVATSFREVAIGGAYSAVRGGIGSAYNAYRSTHSNSDVGTQLAVEQRIAKITTRRAWHSMFSFENLINIIAAMPSFFTGNAPVGVLFLGLGFANDIIIARQENYYYKGILPTKSENIEAIKAATKAAQYMREEDITPEMRNL